MSYAIHRDAHYYPGTCNAPASGLLRDQMGVVATTSKADAVLLVEMLDWRPAGQISMLSHGQYANTEHTIRKSGAPARSLKDCIRALDLHYDWTDDGKRITQ